MSCASLFRVHLPQHIIGIHELMTSCLVLPSPVRTGFQFMQILHSSSLAIPNHTPRHRDPVSLSPNPAKSGGLDRKRVFQLASAHQIVPNHASTVVRSIGQSKMATLQPCAIKKNIALSRLSPAQIRKSDLVRQLVRLLSVNEYLHYKALKKGCKFGHLGTA